MITLASASGNVFAYLWAQEAPAAFDGPRWARRLGRRGEGLGVDGLFLLEPYTGGRPWTLTHWDPDGSQSFCSNGTRAAAALLEPGSKGNVPALVSGEAVLLRLEESGEVGLRLPEGPGYGLSAVALDLPFPHGYGWTGTPHLVVEVPDTETFDLATFGPIHRRHAALPHGANVSVVTLTAPGAARIRTWERGVEGETLCCGQGCAVAGAWLSSRTGVRSWRFQPLGEDPVRVDLQPDPATGWRDLWLSGPVRNLGRLQPGPGLGLG